MQPCPARAPQCMAPQQAMGLSCCLFVSVLPRCAVPGALKVHCPTAQMTGASSFKKAFHARLSQAEPSLAAACAPQPLSAQQPLSIPAAQTEPCYSCFCPLKHVRLEQGKLRQQHRRGCVRIAARGARMRAPAAGGIPRGQAPHQVRACLTSPCVSASLCCRRTACVIQCTVQITPAIVDSMKVSIIPRVGASGKACSASTFLVLPPVCSVKHLG